MQTTRREFLHSSALLALTPAVPAFLRQTARGTSPQKDGRVLVVIQLTGGNDGINTVVPYADDGYARHRKHLRLPTDRLSKLNDQLGLHPSLGDFAKLLDSGRLAIVNGVGYPNPSRSHFKSMAYWHTARFEEKNDDGKFVPSLVTGTGWLGLALDQVPVPRDRAPASLFVGLQPPPPALRGRRSVSAVLNQLDDLTLSGEVSPTKAVLPAQAESNLQAFIRRCFLDAYTTAGCLKDASTVKDAGIKYPASGLADHLRLVARLVRAGFSTRVYYLEHADYDTHYVQLSPHANLLAELGGATRAFLEDLKAAGIAERVAVLVFSEFGRRVAENASYGTDHGTAAPVFLAGGGVKAGLVGKTPSLLDLEAGDLRMNLDFRQVYATVLEDWLGLPAKGVLGEAFARLPLFRA